VPGTARGRPRDSESIGLPTDDVVGDVIASTPVEEFIRQHEAGRAKR
jgi:hypothetical protein